MRWLIRSIVGLMVLALGGVAVLLMLPAERIADFAADRFEAATGRAMTLEGDVRPTLWPELGITTGAVSVANADWSDAGPMLTAEKLAIGVDMSALFGGDIRITRVEAVRPAILLEISPEGRGNWELSDAPAAPSDGEGGVPEFTLDEAVTTGAALRFVDRQSGTDIGLTDIDARLSLPRIDGPADLTLEAASNGQPIEAEVTLGNLGEMLAEQVVPVTLTAAAGKSTIDFNGRAGMTPPAAAGDLTANLADLPALFRALGSAAPDLPGIDAVQLEGAVTYTDAAQATLRDGALRLGDMAFSVNADAALSGERPKLTAQVSTGALDLSPFMASGPSEPSGPGWPKDRIDASALQSLDAEIAFTASALNLGVATLGPTRLLTRVDTGRAVTEIRELQAYGGTATGSVVVNSRGGLSARADLTLADVALKPLLTEFAGYDRVEARGDVRLNLLGVGNDMHALMHSLLGQGSIQMGKGKFIGFDLVGMLRTLDTSYVGEGTSTIFDSVSASFSVEGGVLTSNDLAFSAPLLTASGAGQVALGAQTVDYTLTPELLQSDQGAAIRVPVRISGPWSDPRYALDLEALAEERIGEEVEKLREQAIDEVEERITEELGITVQEGQSVEEVVKEEVEDRVREGLFDLLSGSD